MARRFASATIYPMPSPRSTSARLSDAAARRVKVMLPLPLAESYDYRRPADIDLAPGHYVSVPLGSRTATGIVWETDVAAGPEEIGRAHVCTPVTNAHIVCRIPLEKKKKQ